MTEDAIARLKQIGAEDAIRKAINSKLWSAKKLLEEATHDFSRKLPGDLTSVNNLIRDIRSLYRELPEPPAEKENT